MTVPKYIISIDAEEFNQIIKNECLSAHLSDLIKSNEYKFSSINKQFEEMNKDTKAMIEELKKDREANRKSDGVYSNYTGNNQKNLIDELEKIKQDIKKSSEEHEENNYMPQINKNKKSRN